jgi:hypothetical protein
MPQKYPGRDGFAESQSGLGLSGCCTLGLQAAKTRRKKVKIRFTKYRLLRMRFTPDATSMPIFAFLTNLMQKETECEAVFLI